MLVSPEWKTYEPLCSAVQNAAMEMSVAAVEKCVPEKWGDHSHFYNHGSPGSKVPCLLLEKNREYNSVLLAPPTKPDEE